MLVRYSIRFGPCSAAQGPAALLIVVWLALAAPGWARELPAHWPLREQGPEDAGTSGLRAGVATADITPSYGIPNMNWGSGVHVESTGTDRVGMRVTALVLSDGDRRYAIVDIDRGHVTGLEPAIDEAARRTGISAGHIQLSASHTHASPNVSSEKGPVGADLERYQQQLALYDANLIAKIAGAVVEANAAIRPVHMYGGRGIGTINVNRRFRGGPHGDAAVGLNPDGFVDDEIVVFRIDDSSGRPYAVIFNFQAHGTVLGYANTKVSPDWMGHARRAVEEAIPGVTAMYLQGAAGNLGPREGFTGDLRVAERLGRTLGLQAAAVAMDIETVYRSPVFEGYVESTALQARQPWRVSGARDQRLALGRRVVELPGRQITDEERAAMRRAADRASENAAEFEDDDRSLPAMQARARARRLHGVLDLWKSFDGGDVALEVRALRIGDLAIVSVPGEPFAEIGRAVKASSPFASTMFTGYASGIGRGYLPVADEFPHGGYEIEISPYGPGAAASLIEAAAQLLHELRDAPY